MPVRTLEPLLSAGSLTSLYFYQRIHHTWHGELATRSHFEDFMREIGVDAQLTHLCCVPRQGTRPPFSPLIDC